MQAYADVGCHRCGAEFKHGATVARVNDVSHPELNGQLWCVPCVRAFENLQAEKCSASSVER